MSKLKFPILVLFFSVLLLLLHIIAIDNHLYLNIPIFDNFMHFLGGICIALFAFYLLKSPKWIIPITILIGILWEIFEVFFDIAGYSISDPMYKVDTIKDILLDTIGAFVVWITIRYKR